MYDVFIDISCGLVNVGEYVLMGSKGDPVSVEYSHLNYLDEFGGT